MNILDAKALNKAARAKRKADEAYEKAWRAERANPRKLDVDRFWAIMDYFRKEVIAKAHRFDSKYATDELFRRCICDQLEVGGAKVTFDELVRFIENYNALDSAINTALYNLVSDKSDDSYGDLCDSLPIVGRKGVKKLLTLSEDKWHDNNTVIGIIDDNCPKGVDPEKWRQFIWNGENYFSMFFEDSARERYVREACDHKPREECLV